MAARLQMGTRLETTAGLWKSTMEEVGRLAQSLRARVATQGAKLLESREKRLESTTARESVNLRKAVAGERKRLGDNSSVSDVISVTQSKNGKGHSLTISSCTAVWLIEALNHPPLAREGWNITRYEDQSATKFSWESNSFGSFVKISSGNEKNLKHLFIPVGFNSEGIKLFVNTLIEVDFETGTRLVDEGWKCSSNCLPTGMLEEESKESGYKHLVDSLMEKELEHRKHIPDEVPHIDQESLKIIDQVIRDNRNLFRRSVANKRFFESLNKGSKISGFLSLCKTGYAGSAQSFMWCSRMNGGHFSLECQSLHGKSSAPRLQAAYYPNKPDLFKGLKPGKSYAAATIAQANQVTTINLPHRSVDKFKGLPCISFSKEEVETLAAKPHSLKLLQRYHPDTTERTMESSSSNPRSRVSTHILLNFSSDDDFHRCFKRREWSLGAYKMLISKWTPNFDPNVESPIMPIWISIKNLPIHFHAKESLMQIARIFGNPIKLDSTTENFGRPSIARICVEVDISQPQTNKFFILNGEQPVLLEAFYEEVPLFCPECKAISRHKESCTHFKHADSQTKVQARSLDRNIPKGSGKEPVKKQFQQKTDKTPVPSTSLSQTSQTLQDKNHHSIASKLQRLAILIQQHKVSFAFIIEPKSSIKKIIKFQLELGFTNSISTSNNKIWLMWKDICFSYINHFETDQILTAHLTCHISNLEIFISGIYGKHTVEERKDLWGSIMAHSKKETQACILGGDFNTITSLDHYKGKSSPNLQDDIMCGGAILRTGTGRFIGAKSAIIQGTENSEEGELASALMGLKWAVLIIPNRRDNKTKLSKSKAKEHDMMNREPRTKNKVLEIG
ncbi:hypothetical protein DM860_011142 [Cuscuta australis]|uniref:Uncharacterized protein n=1 Tax=Cuscuta australis TaxID=267555 RepID=A0A328DAL3_9ASTE|nr:hypothetical protein DM860_011142 [Cuscuta australis]